jgi:hypothetical protein
MTCLPTVSKEEYYKNRVPFSQLTQMGLGSAWWEIKQAATHFTFGNVPYHRMPVTANNIRSPGGSKLRFCSVHRTSKLSNVTEKAAAMAVLAAKQYGHIIT